MTLLCFTLIVAGVTEANSDDAAYWRAKAVSAIAIQSVISAEMPRVMPAHAVERGDSRPVVTMWSAAWCVPCQRAKVELKAIEDSLPFVVKVVDVDRAGWPQGVDSIPHFEWDSPRGRLFAKWNGVKDLVDRWRVSQEKGK